MTMGDALREVERAVDSLRRLATDSSGWTDQQRVRFDQQRLQPLLQAGDLLIAALRRADDDLERVRHALGSDD